MAKKAPNPEEQKFDPGDLASFACATNIDRRKCRRVVPMRVLGLGVSRTGTSSMRQALIDLGYKDCYHYSAALQENPRDMDMWIEAMEAKYLHKGKPFKRSDWDQLLGHCQAVTDTPCAIFYQELLEIYPDAKVVLTIRDSADQWFKSQMLTIMPLFEDFLSQPSSIWQLIYGWFRPVNKQNIRLSRLIVENYPMYQALWQDYQQGTESAKRWYEEYIEEIKRLVPPERLLITNVKEGWKPLCSFLGEEEPQYPFPRKNDTAVFQANHATFGAFLQQETRKNAMKVFGVGVVAFALTVWIVR